MNNNLQSRTNTTDQMINILKDSLVTLVDISKEALEVARLNANNLNLNPKNIIVQNELTINCPK